MPIVRTQALRTRTSEWISGAGPAAPIPTHIAFGTGGANAGEPTTPTGDEAALVNEVHRNSDLTRVMGPEHVVVSGYINGDTVGSITVNEAGLFTAGGTLIAYATFTARAVSPGTRQDFEFQL